MTERIDKPQDHREAVRLLNQINEAKIFTQEAESVLKEFIIDNRMYDVLNVNWRRFKMMCR